ncbi:MAG: helix-turn-helix domain-containing protein, partial [Gammaproteobacteria bacterium]|nr:helix-turn-helix domain-containing protein [Gammaproteobacteria bacterium]
RVWRNRAAGGSGSLCHFYNLRQALDRPFDRPLIVTVPGRGYRLDLPEPDEGQNDAGSRRP